jgi:virulence factor
MGDADAGGRDMRVAVVGLGDIAQKAYLPVLAATPGVQPVLVTRNAETLAAVGAKYRIDERFTDLDEAAATRPDAAFVHTSTDSHVQVVKTLLAQRIPVYVDKPLALHYGKAAETVALASELGVSLMVGFNRRTAPAYREVAQWPDKRVVFLNRHRVNPMAGVRLTVFDDFIHVVDTLRYLVPSTLDDMTVAGHVDDEGLLHYVAIQFSGSGVLARGFTSRLAGGTQEMLEVLGTRRQRQILELAEIRGYGDGETFRRRDEWVPVGVQRGFTSICEQFLGSVARGDLLKADDALRTHAACERIVSELGAT